MTSQRIKPLLNDITIIAPSSTALFVFKNFYRETIYLTFLGKGCHLRVFTMFALIIYMILVSLHGNFIGLNVKYFTVLEIQVNLGLFNYIAIYRINGIITKLNTSIKEYPNTANRFTSTFYWILVADFLVMI